MSDSNNKNGLEAIDVGVFYTHYGSIEVFIDFLAKSEIAYIQYTKHPLCDMESYEVIRSFFNYGHLVHEQLATRFYMDFSEMYKDDIEKPDFLEDFRRSHYVVTVLNDLLKEKKEALPNG